MGEQGRSETFSQIDDEKDEELAIATAEVSTEW
jgi:hypothetical protein